LMHVTPLHASVPMTCHVRTGRPSSVTSQVVPLLTRVTGTSARKPNSSVVGPITEMPSGLSAAVRVRPCVSTFANSSRTDQGAAFKDLPNRERGQKAEGFDHGVLANASRGSPAAAATGKRCAQTHSLRAAGKYNKFASCHKRGLVRAAGFGPAVGIRRGQAPTL